MKIFLLISHEKKCLQKTVKRQQHLFKAMLFLIIFFLSNPMIAQEFSKEFKDTTDNAFDLSNWLLRREGILPVPTIITEPAVGFGGAAALLYFHSSFLERKGPPDISGVAGGYTENRTWGLGAFHAGFWKNDRIRYTGALFKLNVNVKFYGSGLILKEPVKFYMDSWMLFQQIKFRLTRSNFFLGGRYFLYNTRNRFEIPINIPDFEGVKFNSTLSEVAVIIDYESRDNVFPRKVDYLRK